MKFEGRPPILLKESFIEREGPKLLVWGIFKNFTKRGGCGGEFSQFSFNANLPMPLSENSAGLPSVMLHGNDTYLVKESDLIRLERKDAEMNRWMKIFRLEQRFLFWNLGIKYS